MKQRILEQIRTTWEAWENALECVPPQEAEAPLLSGGWSVRDLVAHILWYEREILEVVRTQRFGGSPWWTLPLDERNARIRAAAHHLGYASLRKTSRQTHAQLVTLLEALPAQDWLVPFPGMPKEWQPWQVIAENTCAHYPEHTLQVQMLFPREEDTNEI
ncbi:MAG: ClbS/DfsB family four-helix bundle protein [Anaerolineae bacterium]|nr:MAG: ClbS/DfsB family four-helix bundle protein [Anaerolineae bacterium]